MDYKKPKPKSELETAGSDRLRELMHREGWHTEKTHGSMYMKGWPDLYAMHLIHGQRWIETKTKNGNLEDTQLKKFAIWSKYNIGVWILRDEKDYQWLFQDANAYKFALPKRLRPE